MGLDMRGSYELKAWKLLTWVVHGAREGAGTAVPREKDTDNQNHQT